MLFLDYYTACCGNSLPTFRDNLLVPSSRVNNPISCAIFRKGAGLVNFAAEAWSHAVEPLAFWFQRQKLFLLVTDLSYFIDVTSAWRTQNFGPKHLSDKRHIWKHRFPKQVPERLQIKYCFPLLRLCFSDCWQILVTNVYLLWGVRSSYRSVSITGGVVNLQGRSKCNWKF